jgi:hypothetical protein
VRRAAIALSCQHAGAVAFARTGDPATGEFQDRVVLAHFGDTSMSYSRLFQTLRWSRSWSAPSARIQSQGLHRDAPRADALAKKILKLAQEGVKNVDALTEMAVGQEYDSG